jgi:dTMP kinase
MGRMLDSVGCSWYRRRPPGRLLGVDTGQASSGLFVVLEGPDGAGKSRAAAALVDQLRSTGRTVVAVREPGGTPLGEALRDILLRAGVVDRTAVADALLFSAARAELVSEVIRPALRAGAIVVSDRYATSTTAYQGYGGGVDLEQLASLERLATGGLRPDLILLIDVPVDAGLARRAAGVHRETRFEEHFDRAFHERVRVGYLEMAAADPERWRILDGTRTEADVARAAADHVQGLVMNGEPFVALARTTS